MGNNAVVQHQKRERFQKLYSLLLSIIKCKKNNKKIQIAQKTNIVFTLIKKAMGCHKYGVANIYNRRTGTSNK